MSFIYGAKVWPELLEKLEEYEGWPAAFNPIVVRSPCGRLVWGHNLLKHDINPDGIWFATLPENPPQMHFTVVNAISDALAQSCDSVHGNGIFFRQDTSSFT